MLANTQNFMHELFNRIRMYSSINGQNVMANEVEVMDWVNKVRDASSASKINVNL